MDQVPIAGGRDGGGIGSGYWGTGSGLNCAASGRRGSVADGRHRCRYCECGRNERGDGDWRWLRFRIAISGGAAVRPPGSRGVWGRRNDRGVCGFSSRGCCMGPVLRPKMPEEAGSRAKCSVAASECWKGLGVGVVDQAVILGLATTIRFAS
ncbi:unnamed protein product [Schistocephalus solidus]|uniref:Uncharacterized protein n=1 Tax=Schistocephalus solidus TaxID=70667 RepID=A0A183TD00_SCHSO|nr:unnamed protein product [Schistocephalus solidus]